MEYWSVAIPQNASHKVVAALGKLGSIQFVDLNQELTAFQRRFVDQVKRCNSLERILEFFQEVIDQHGIPIPDLLETQNPLEDGSTQTLADLEEIITENEEDLRTFTENEKKLQEVYNSCLEKKYVYKEILSNQRDRSLVDEAEGVGISGVKFSYLAGVIDAEEKVSFAKMIFRASRGNCFVRFEDINEDIPAESFDASASTGKNAMMIARTGVQRVATVMRGNAYDGTVPVKFKDPETGKEVEKVVFVAMYSSTAIERQLKKICDAYEAHVYEVPDEESGSLEGLLREAESEIDEAWAVLEKTKKAAERKARALCNQLNFWKLHVASELGIYHTLNKFRMLPSSGVVVGKGWVIQEKVEELRAAIVASDGEDGKTVMSKIPMPWPEPPTHFFTNKYIENFQGMTNTYGVPVYGEANPAMFTSITFPFLFAMMFGDFGHGFCWFTIAVLLIAFEKKFERATYDEGPMGMLLRARYMILLMGFFAMYCGLMYNETFALPMDLFGKYSCPSDSPHANNCTGTWDKTEFYKNGGPVTQIGVYPFGLDPTWAGSVNELNFENSLKMKLSVIFGILQMTIGVFLKGSNALYFKNYLVFAFEFVPQILFMASLFWYMIFAIVYKWTQPWTDYAAPSLINGLINIALKPNLVDPPLYGNSIQKGSMWGGDCPACPADGTMTGSCCTGTGKGETLSCACFQQTIQNLLGLLAVVCIVWMLVPKPLIEFFCVHKNHGHGHGDEHHDPKDAQDEDEFSSFLDGGDHGEEEHETHGCGDLFIHQGIETIEYVLGCISNTASYLRLWALSLAHMELAKTFWDLIMVNIINNLKSPYYMWFGIFIAWSAFFGATFAVLLAMDFLECFLHALRLHWVEFQNKFYKADGYPFQPFSFKTIKSTLIKAEVNS